MSTHAGGSPPSGAVGTDASSRVTKLRHWRSLSRHGAWRWLRCGGEVGGGGRGGGVEVYLLDGGGQGGRAGEVYARGAIKAPRETCQRGLNTVAIQGSE